MSHAAALPIFWIYFSYIGFLSVSYIFPIFHVFPGPLSVVGKPISKQDEVDGTETHDKTTTGR